MSNFNENKIRRQASGTSAGGQFANKEHQPNDGVGLAVAEHPRAETVVMTDRRWPAGTEVTFTQVTGGNWLVEAVAKIPNKNLVDSISRHTSVGRTHVNNLVKTHRQELNKQFQDPNRYGTEVDWVGDSNISARLERGNLVARLHYLASDRRVRGNDLSDPAFASELLNFGTNSSSQFISLTDGGEVAENLRRAVDERVLNRGTEVEQLGRGDTVVVSHPDYPGEWEIVEPAPVDPAGEHAQFVEEMRSSYGPDHPGANVPPPPQVGQAFEVTERERDEYWEDHDADFLNPRHAALTLGFERWWVRPTPSNSLRKTAPASMVAVSNLEMRKADLPAPL